MQAKRSLLIICFNALVVCLFLSVLQVHLIALHLNPVSLPSGFWEADCSFGGTKSGCPSSNFYSHACRSLVSTSSWDDSVPPDFGITDSFVDNKKEG